MEIVCFRVIDVLDCIVIMLFSQCTEAGRSGHRGRRAAPRADGRDGSECACATTRDLRTAVDVARGDDGKTTCVPDGRLVPVRFNKI